MAPRILLTGGLGYIGSHTCLELLRNGYEPIILDDLSNSKKGVLRRLTKIAGKKPKFIKASVTDRDAVAHVFKKESIDAVIHFAALKAVGESVRRPLEYFNTNITGFNNVLLEMQNAGVENIVYSSSATVYGADAELPFQEGSGYGVTSPYGFTKITCENMLEIASAADEALNYGILRYFNPAGADRSGMIGEDPEDIPNNLMPILAAVATGTLDKVSVYGDDYDTPDGTGLRDYIHVTDLAMGHILSLRALFNTGKSHTVNLGTGRGYSVLELIKAYEKASGVTIPVEIAPRRTGDIAEMQASVSLAEEILGFKASLGLDDMCESSWNWINTGAKMD